MDTMLKTYQGIAWSLLTQIEGIQAEVEHSTIAFQVHELYLGKSTQITASFCKAMSGFAKP